MNNDEGNTLIIVILVSMVIGMLGSLILASGRQADWSSASDRNHEQSLGASEAGVQEQIARLESQQAGTYISDFPNIDSTLPQGSYHVETTRCPATDTNSTIRTTHQGWCNGMGVTSGFVVDGTGTTGVKIFKRARHIRVSLIPPPIFPEPGGYALFSYTSITLKNNDTINQGATIPGNAWANDSITLANNDVVNGSITSAQSWIDSSQGTVLGNVWSGGFDPNRHMALTLGTVGGWARASVTAPTDPQTCGGQDPSNYVVQGGNVAGDITTWGTTITSTAGGTKSTAVCSAAAAAKPMPGFTYNRNDYDPSTLHEFTSVADFNTWKTNNAGALNAITGTFYIQDANPSESNQVNLDGFHIAGDLTVVTNAPIYGASMSDASLPNGVRPVVTIVSHYTPDHTKNACAYQGNGADTSECSIHFKNNFQPGCITATLLYADNGPVGLKNNAQFCGSVVESGIEIKNNLDIVYDPRAGSRVGFGPETFKVGRWEELPT